MLPVRAARGGSACADSVVDSLPGSRSKLRRCPGPRGSSRIFAVRRALRTGCAKPGGGWPSATHASSLTACPRPKGARPRRWLAPPGKGASQEDNAEHRRIRARVEHTLARMKNWKILRDCRRKGERLRHAVQADATMHSLAPTG
ncbi:transposase [Streptomyces roseus]